MSAEIIPAWAQALIEKVTILSERLPNHIDFTERNIQDHESRLRDIEATNATLASVAQAQVKLDESLVEVFTRLRSLEKKVWMAVGGLTLIGIALGVVCFNINLN
jgi:hypothetical protein